MNQSEWRTAAALAGAAALLRLPLLARMPGGWDAVDFALALERYDLAAMQPHFPGYPVLIWLGRLAHAWVGEPVLSLALVSGVAGAAAVALFYLLARSLLAALALPEQPAHHRRLPAAWREELRRAGSLPTAWEDDQARAAALLAAAWFGLSPLVWLSATQPMSESLGLAALLAMLCCAWRWWIAPRPPAGWAAAAGLALGLTLGVRLSYFPFAVTLAAVGLGRLLWRGRRPGPELWAAAAAAAGLAAGVLPWLAWLIGREGAVRLWELAVQFTHGHLTDWGNAVGSPLSPPGRAVQVILYNWLGAGLGGPVPGGAIWRVLTALVTVGGLAAWVWPRERARPGAGPGPARPGSREGGRDAGAGRDAGGTAEEPGGAGGGSGSGAQDDRSPGAHQRAWVFLAAWLVPYLLWAYLGQNPLNPRHVLPLVPWAIVLVTGGWLRWARSSLAFLVQAAPAGLALAGAGNGCGLGAGARWAPVPVGGAAEPEPVGPGPAARRRIVMAGAAVLLAALWATAFPLVLSQHLHPPPAGAMARYLAGAYPPRETRLYTWEEERLVRYYAPEFTVIRLRRPEDFLRDLLAAPAPPRHILATSYVLEGFGPGGDAIRRFFHPVATFAGDAQVFPTYHRIILYEAGPELYEYARRQ